LWGSTSANLDLFVLIKILVAKYGMWAGQNHREIGRALNISRDMARLWRNRWLELSGKPLSVVERLTDAPRPGGPMTFSLEQILQLFAIACEPPADYDRPLSHWTARELADEMLKPVFRTSFEKIKIDSKMATE
jgi:putative transposase